MAGPIPTFTTHQFCATESDLAPVCVLLCSDHPCLCGDPPGWLLPVLRLWVYDPTGASNPSLTSMKHCSLDADLVCGYFLWPAEYLQDARELLSLKASAYQQSQTLLTWRGSVPPCTNSTGNATCAMCSEDVPGEMCGSVWGSGGVQLCNWRYIECRDRRVVTINLADKVCATRRSAPLVHLSNTGCRAHPRTMLVPP